MSETYKGKVNIPPAGNLTVNKSESEEFTFDDSRVIRYLLQADKLTESERASLRRLYRTYQSSL